MYSSEELDLLFKAFFFSFTDVMAVRCFRSMGRDLNVAIVMTLISVKPALRIGSTILGIHLEE